MTDRSQPDDPPGTPPPGELRVLVHLVAADGLLRSERGRHSARAYWTVCGEAVADSNLPHAICPQERDGEPSYCPTCLRQATVRNTETDARIAAAAGIVGEEPSSSSRTELAALQRLVAGSAS
ncbi:MAG: hypothetical protein JO115_13565 [Pseudonocardiales bacterium]|nr:hypothetical protein [Pseudonocardiales bacterium]